MRRRRELVVPPADGLSRADRQLVRQVLAGASLEGVAARFGLSKAEAGIRLRRILEQAAKRPVGNG